MLFGENQSRTRSRLSRLLLLGASLLVLSPPILCQSRPAITSVASYYTDDDQYQHAITSSDACNIRETYFDPKRGDFHDDLGCYGPILNQSSFYSADDKMQHVLIAKPDGSVRELLFSAGTGVKLNPPLITVPSLLWIAGFYAADDNSRILITGSSDGSIREVFYDKANNIHGGEIIATIPNLTKIAGFYTPDDKMRHVIVATSQGDVIEVFYSSATGVHVTTPPLAHMAGVAHIAAFYTPDDKLRHAIVATSDGAIHEIFYGGKIPPTVSQPALATMSGIGGIGAYYTPSDNNRHVIVGLASGDVREVFYNPKTGVGNDELWQVPIPTPVATDVSPDTANGVSISSPSSSGVAEQFAGDQASLYLVTMDAGVAVSSAGGPWKRLTNSPRYAYSIAVDPANRAHLAVGERTGDTASLTQPAVGLHTGLWESFDSGSTWKLTYDPIQANCSPAAIPAVAFTPKSTLVIATACGVARRSTSNPTFTMAIATTNVGVITGLVVSDTVVWARSATVLLRSTDDGQTFQPRTIPAQYTFPSRGDVNSLAAFDQAAYMTCCQVATPPCANVNQLLIYNSAADHFSLQTELFASDGKTPQLGCDGTGLGGSRFVHAYQSPQPIRAQNHRLFYSGAEEVYEATSFNPDWSAKAWTRPVGATCGGCTNQDNVHSDFWDFFMTPDGKAELLGNDGGVYKRALTAGIIWSAWTQQNSNLHTHHAHTIDLFGTESIGRANMIYATSDNDAWYWSPSGGWNPADHVGDANWTVSDAGNATIALDARSLADAELISFGTTLSNGKSAQAITISNDSAGNGGPTVFPVVQSLENEIRTPLSLDVFLLANLPLRYEDASKAFHNVPGPLGSSPPAGMHNPVLLRNSNYAANPDINISKGNGWTIASGSLPAGAYKVWVSGGHTNTTYFVLADQSGSLRLYKSNSPLSTWTELNVQGNSTLLKDPSQKKPWPPSDLLDGSATYGPIFVNPYDPMQIYALTKQGVRVSTNGGASFPLDTTLTNLITGNGAFPLVGSFSGGNDFGIRLSTRAVDLGTLAAMDFRRDDPELAVAASPFTGAFFRDKSGKWHDLGPLLPHPLSSVSSVRIDCDGIYVATEGGGLTRISGYDGIP